MPTCVVFSTVSVTEEVSFTPFEFWTKRLIFASFGLNGLSPPHERRSENEMAKMK
jgi:hypothetical protein